MFDGFVSPLQSPRHVALHFVQLGVPVNGGERRTQFVTGVRDEPLHFSVVSSCAWKLSSMRVSMVFSDMDREPTSVLSGRSGTRWLRSPAAIFFRGGLFNPLQGRELLCTRMVPSIAPISTTAMPTIAQNRVNVLAVSI